MDDDVGVGAGWRIFVSFLIFYLLYGRFYLEFFIRFMELFLYRRILIGRLVPKKASLSKKHLETK